MQGKTWMMRIGRCRFTIGWLLALAACGDQGGVQEITRTRTLERPVIQVVPGVSDSLRFGEVPAQRSAPVLMYDVPEGWQELPPTDMRRANFQVGGPPAAECYLTVLGAGGGLLDNINRWRGQMSLEPIGAAEVEALPRELLLGGPAVRLDLRGPFAGMGAEPMDDARMLGLILDLGPDGMAFLKMVGPADIVDVEVEHFDQLAGSMRLEVPPSDDPHGFGAHGGQARFDPSRLKWTVPDGWTRTEDKPQRLVNFSLSERTEAYVSVLGGDGGGLVANINRWQGQMGQPPLSPAQIQELPRVNILGTPSYLVEIEGEFTDMMGVSQSGSALLGAVCMLQDASLFVKMTGSKEEVAAARDDFLGFCESLN